MKICKYKRSSSFLYLVPHISHILTISRIFSKATWVNQIKPPGVQRKKTCSSGPDQTSDKAAMPIFGKNLVPKPAD